jgi:hypothetical protein
MQLELNWPEQLSFFLSEVVWDFKSQKNKIWGKKEFRDPPAPGVDFLVFFLEKMKSA